MVRWFQLRIHVSFPSTAARTPSLWRVKNAGWDIILAITSMSKRIILYRSRNRFVEEYVLADIHKIQQRRVSFWFVPLAYSRCEDAYNLCCTVAELIFDPVLMSTYTDIVLSSSTWTFPFPFIDRNSLPNRKRVTGIPYVDKSEKIRLKTMLILIVDCALKITDAVQR